MFKRCFAQPRSSHTFCDKPDRELVRARGAIRWLMHGTQLLAVFYGAWAAKEMGVARFAGLTDAILWFKRRGNKTHLCPMPRREAQGPTVDETGKLLTGGPFQFSRHPLNFVPLVIFWMMPRLTRNSLVFNTLMSFYLVAGSWHEEQRLADAYGEAFQSYRESGVPFFFPRWRRHTDLDAQEDGAKSE
jgi:hypothetical protein